MGQIEDFLEQGNLDGALAHGKFALQENSDQPQLRQVLVGLSLMGFKLDDAEAMLTESIKSEDPLAQLSKQRLPYVRGWRKMFDFYNAGESEPGALFPPNEQGLLHATMVVEHARDNFRAVIAEVQKLKRVEAGPWRIETTSSTVEVKALGDVDPLGGPILPLVLPDAFVWLPLAEVKSLEFRPPMDGFDSFLRRVEVTFQRPFRGKDSLVMLFPAMYANPESRDFVNETRGVTVEQIGQDYYRPFGWRSFLIKEEKEDSVIPASTIKKISRVES